jgi:hypothetical protein
MLEVELLTLDPKPSTISKISLPNIRICCRNSSLPGLINLSRRNKWFSPFSPNLISNTQYLYPHFIKLGSPLDPPRICPLLRSLLNLLHKRITRLSTWEKSKDQRSMKLLYNMVEIIQIRNIKKNKKGIHMKIQRRKGTQNPSMMPPDPKVERE